MRPPRLLVVGAGITGLAAAYEARRAGAEVTVVDGAQRAGGRILTTPFAGLPLDAGPDAFLARVPDATELCRQLGLGDELVAPTARAAYVWTGSGHHGAGGLRPFPERLLLGVPTDLEALARSGALSAAGVARAAEDLERPADGPPGGADESVGDLIRRRLGPEVLDTLVDPLLSGIYAGDTDRLSLLAGAPQLATAARSGASLIAGARKLLPAPPAGTDRHEPPVFLTLVGGLGRLVDALLGALFGAAGARDAGGSGSGPVDRANPRSRLLLGQPVCGLRRRPNGGFTAELGTRGPEPEPVEIQADGVVLTCPAPAAGALLSRLAPDAARLLAGIDYASVTLVSLAFEPADVHQPLDGSGFLVARSAGLLMTACSWSSSKFAHLGRDGRIRLRLSAGRWGDDRPDRLDDAALVGALRTDLATTLGIEAPPVASRVSRWPASLPQYTLGHLDRLAAVEAELAGHPGLHASGAAFRGVGLPACIAQGRAAARTVLARLG